jgi:hypothetical protein
LVDLWIALGNPAVEFRNTHDAALKMLQSGVFVVSRCCAVDKDCGFCCQLMCFDAVMQRPIVPSHSQFPALITSFDF